MNYGADSRLTEDDKKDLKRMYQMAWNGELTEINGTPIKFVKPFHTVAETAENLVAFPAATAPQTVAAYRG
jgi:adenylylsulfate kinase-like enzyme